MNLPSGTVTFLFTDIEDSTRLWDKQPEAMAVAHAQHDEILRTAIASNNGYIFQIVGDSFSAAFHNALDGVNASVQAQRALAKMKDASGSGSSSPGLKVRMGLHTGTASILTDGKYEGYVTIATTQRVMSVAYGDQILLSHTTRDLLPASLPESVFLQDLGEHQLKSLRAPLRLYQLCIPGLRQDFPPLKSLTVLPNNLPIQLTSFIGRENEMREASSLLSSTRLLTLIGPGGTGKTRLSIQIAEEQLTGFEDGVWMIELAPITDPANIITSLATVFGLREVQGVSLTDTVVDYLRSKHLLLILDNCEHLIEATAQLTDLILHSCPKVKIIASSREALGVSGETVYRVPSLKDGDSTRLFIERATKADSRFRKTEHNASFIAQICSRLDGIPLAIELAAARVTVFSPEQIALRLDDRFKLLTGGSRTALPRQQTLRALIDWSYQILNETEQRTLRRLAVFSGGWTFEAAEKVVGEADAFDGLAGLVNKSLVNVDVQDGASRYSFLETIRQYAMEKLVETGEAIETRTRHLNYILEFIGETEPSVYDGLLNWLGQIDSEHDNLRAALEWSISNEIEKAIRLVLRAGSYWLTRDYISEGLFWYRTTLQRTESLTGHDEERAAIYSWLGWACILVGQHREGRAASETAIALAKRSDERMTWSSPGVIRTMVLANCTRTLASVFLGDLATAQDAILEAETLAQEKGLHNELALVKSTHAQMVYFTTRDMDTARQYLDEALKLSTSGGYRWEAVFQVFAQARLAATLGDLDIARQKFEESTTIARRMGNKRLVYSNRSELAHALRENGKFAEAYEIYKEVIPGWKDLGHRAAIAHELECIGYIMRHQEQLESSAILLSAAQALRHRIEIPRTKREDVEYEKEAAILRGLLGEDEYQRLWDRGSSLSMEEAIHLALEGNHE